MDEHTKTLAALSRAQKMRSEAIKALSAANRRLERVCIKTEEENELFLKIINELMATNTNASKILLNRMAALVEDFEERTY